MSSHHHCRLRFLFCLLLTYPFLSYGQQKIQRRQRPFYFDPSSIRKDTSKNFLHKGDTLPDLPLALRTGDSISSVHLGDYKGKLIILDFWSTRCPDCIAGLPGMMSLQQQFGDRIKIIVVTADKPGEVRDFWAWEKGHLQSKIFYAASHLPFVEGDTIFHQLAKYAGNSFHAWIDKDRVYRNLSYSFTTTHNNIEAFLNGNEPTLAEFSPTPVDREHPIQRLNQALPADDTTLYYSFFSPRIRKINILFGVGNIQENEITHQTTGIYLANNTILEMYKHLYALENKKNFYTISSTSFSIETKDIYRYIYAPTDSTWLDWADKNTYCYAIQVPPSRSGELYETMHKDLDNYFHLSSSWQEKTVKCYALRRISKEDKIKSRYTLPYEDIDVNEHDQLVWTFQDTKMFEVFSTLQGTINQFEPFTPVLDETNYEGPIDIELPTYTQIKDSSIQDLKTALNKYGLDLVEEYKKMRVMVIKEASQQ